MHHQNVYQIPCKLFRTITVTGNGKVSAKPDYVQLQIEVLTKGNEVSQAVQENAAIMEHVISSLLTLGIPREDIQTSVYTISPSYDYIDGKKVFRGYEVANTITVKIRDINQIGIVIDTAVKNGANSVSGIQFKIEHAERYYQQALSLALQNAQKKANTIAKTMHLQIPPYPIQITEESVVEPILYKTAAITGQSVTTPIEPGLITVNATLSVKFKY